MEILGRSRQAQVSKDRFTFPVAWLQLLLLLLLTLVSYRGALSPAPLKTSPHKRSSSSWPVRPASPARPVSSQPARSVNSSAQRLVCSALRTRGGSQVRNASHQVHRSKALPIR